MAARTATGVATRGRTRKKKNPVVRWIKRIVLTLLTIFCIGFIAGAVVFITAYKEAQTELSDLPVLMANLQKQPTIIYSADGQKLYIVASQFRRPVESKDIPKVVKDAVVAAEDVRFYQHKGVDIPSLFRIAVDAAREGKFSQGGSTLTMQLAKRLYHGSQKTVQRKVKDMALAVAMERELTKDQILTLYLNDVFFGNNAYGIRAASEVYLGKELNDLDASDAALLVRCVRKPSTDTPFDNYEKSIENRNVVLKIMHDQGMISDAVYEHSLREKPRLNPNPPSTGARLLGAPYFINHILKVLKQDMPDIDFTEGGYKIYTTLDARLQKVAEQSVKKTIDENRRHKVSTGACILIDYKGRILAEVGGYDYNKDQYDVVFDGKRQPGSSFKSYLYSAAIDRGIIDEDSSISNELQTYTDQWGNSWTPHNDDGRSGGYASAKKAFALSLNVCAAHVLDKLGPQTLVDYAHNTFGFTTHLDPLMSLALGTEEVSPLEMARGYSVFMTGGDRVEPYCIDRVVGQDGQVIRKYEPQITQNVLSPRVVNQMRDLQQAVVDYGTAYREVHGKVKDARGKTGTTSDNKDAWFCGYSDGLECISWVANEQRTKGGSTVWLPMSSRIFGGTTATLIWVPVMNAALKDYAVDMPNRDENAPPEASAQGSQTDQKSHDEWLKSHVNDMVAPDQSQDANSDNGDSSGDNGTNPPATPGDASVPGDSIPPVQPLKPIVQKQPPPPKKVEYVTVEVCADSHELATMYCPETVMRTYIKGQEPKTYCHLHKPN